jgi:hypothetical protein
MKILLRFATAIGPRTIVAEIGDRETAQAIVNSHVAANFAATEPAAHLVDEMPRLSLKAHMAKHKRARVKVVSALPANVTPMRKAKP